MARFAQISRGAPTALRMINFAAAVYAVAMSDNVKSAVPVLPAVDVAESLEWWTARCGFTEAFRDNTPPNYAGISGGDAHLHLAGMNDAKRGRSNHGADPSRGRGAMYAEYQQRGGVVHPNGPLQTKPWGTKELE
jgi:hypothetical protein